MLDGQYIDIKPRTTKSLIPVRIPFNFNQDKVKLCKFLDYSFCPVCKINSTVESKNRLFCISCESYINNNDKDVKINSSCYIGNKFIHFKNIIKRLLTRTDNSEIISELRMELDELGMDIKDVDSNFISKRLKDKKLYVSKDYKKVCEILSDLNNKHIKDMSEEMFDQVAAIFQSFVLFIQSVRDGKSINYNFFLNKIFMSVNEMSFLHPQMVKNQYKNNDNQLIWDMFVKFSNEEEIRNTVGKMKVLLPPRAEISFDQEFEYSLII